MEIETLEQFEEHLAAGAPLHGLRLQNLDLTGYAARLASVGDLSGLVVLGGTVPLAAGEILLRGGAVVFPAVRDEPLDPWKGLYHPEELYAGLAEGYDATPDARTYRWSIDARVRVDAYSTLVRAIHDDSVTDELDEFVEGRSVVGIMGGHSLARGTEGYAAAASLGHRLAERGHLVVTGGGPGAMEAANLGALARSTEDLTTALVMLAEVPGFEPDVTAWATVAMQVRTGLLGVGADLPTDVLGPSARSLGIPTWFYGHEPPNVFCDAVAKYFSNAIREDGLLSRSTAGIIVMPGAAGTVQEIFQAITPLYYAPEDEALPPLVLVGHHHWSEQVPVWPAVRALARGRRMEDLVHLVDDLDQGLDLVGHPAAPPG